MSTTPNSSQHTPGPKERTKLIASIKKLVPERHINVSNPNQDYGPWLTLVDKRTTDLLNADAPAFEAGVSELLKELGSSHTAFFHQRRDSIPAPYSINATLRAVDRPEGKRWMFVDVIEDGVAFQAGIRPGEAACVYVGAAVFHLRRRAIAAGFAGGSHRGIEHR